MVLSCQASADGKGLPKHHTEIIYIPTKHRNACYVPLLPPVPVSSQSPECQSLGSCALPLVPSGENSSLPPHLGELINDVLLFNNLQPQEIHFPFFLAVVKVIEGAWSPYCSSSLPLESKNHRAEEEMVRRLCQGLVWPFPSQQGMMHLSGGCPGSSPAPLLLSLTSRLQICQMFLLLQLEKGQGHKSRFPRDYEVIWAGKLKVNHRMSD